MSALRDEFWAADLQALNTTVAEIRGTTFDEMLSQGRPALTTGLDEAWYLDHGTDPRTQKHPSRR